MSPSLSPASPQPTAPAVCSRGGGSGVICGQHVCQKLPLRLDPLCICSSCFFRPCASSGRRGSNLYCRVLPFRHCCHSPPPLKNNVPGPQELPHYEDVGRSDHPSKGQCAHALCLTCNPDLQLISQTTQQTTLGPPSCTCSNLNQHLLWSACKLLLHWGKSNDGVQRREAKDAMQLTTELADGIFSLHPQNAKNSFIMQQHILRNLARGVWWCTLWQQQCVQCAREGL